MARKLRLIGKSGKMGAALQRLIAQSKLYVLDDLAPDAIIDFSHPSRLDETISLKKPAIIGTTGYSEKELQKMQAASEYMPILYSANFSMGIAALKKMAHMAAALLEGCDIDIIEVHHTQKKDLPSGTALALAASLQAPPKIHSIRSKGIIGRHTIFLNTGKEELELTHRAMERDVFAIGALKTVEFICKKKSGLYSLEDFVEETLLCNR